MAERVRSLAVEQALTRAVIALCSWSFVQTRIQWDPSTMRHGQTKRRHCQPTVAAWRGGVCEPQFLQSLYDSCGSSKWRRVSCEQQLNNSSLVPDSVEEIRVFQACASGWRCDTRCRALAHTRKCAFFPIVSVPVLWPARTQSHRRRSAVCATSVFI